MQELEVVKAGAEKSGRKIFYRISRTWHNRWDRDHALRLFCGSRSPAVEGYDRSPKRAARGDRTGCHPVLWRGTGRTGWIWPEWRSGDWSSGSEMEDVKMSCREPAIWSGLTAKKYIRAAEFTLGDLCAGREYGVYWSCVQLNEKDPQTAEEFRWRSEEAIKAAVAEQTHADSMGEQMAGKANRLDGGSQIPKARFRREATAKELHHELPHLEEEVKEIAKMSLDAISVVETDITWEIGWDLPAAHRYRVGKRWGNEHQRKAEQTEQEMLSPYDAEQ